MTNNHFEEWAEENGKLIDEIAKQNYVKDSPEYNLQQGLINAMRRYREAKGLKK